MTLYERFRLCMMASVASSAVAFSHATNAQLYFHFVEDGSDVTMTASGCIDTTQLVSTSPLYGGWGGRGVETNDGEVDIMGDTDGFLVDNDAGFVFSGGTDLSAWADASGPFASDFFSFNGGDTSTTTQFSTYVGDNGRVSGLSVAPEDIAEGVWTPDAFWRAEGETFSSTGLQVGTYTIADASTAAFITIQVGGASPPPPSVCSTPEAPAATPVPTMPLFGLLALGVLLGLFGLRKLKQ